MKEYYLFIENKKVGPLTIEELATYKINFDSLVWFQGQKDWEKIKNIEELSSLIKVPPPHPYEIKEEQKKHNKQIIRAIAKALLYSLLISTIIFLISISLYNYTYYLKPDMKDVKWGPVNVEYGDHLNFIASQFYGNVEIKFPTDINGRPFGFKSKEDETIYCTKEFRNILLSRIYEYKNHILMVSGIYSLVGFPISVLVLYIILIKRTRNQRVKK
jgi:GYF domain 2